MKTPQAHDLRRTPGSWRRFIGAIVALLVVALGIPIALVFLSQTALDAWHPVPGIGSWSEIGDWFQHELSSSQIAVVVLRVLIVVMWLLWLSLLVSVLSSVASSRPSLERFHLPRLTAFDGIGAWIAAGLTALTSLTPNVAHTSARQPAAPIIVMHDAPSAAPAPVSTPRAAPRTGWARVQTGESVEMFAARTLGDSTRWEEIWILNRGRAMDDHGTTWTDAWRLLAGWDLELPPQTDSTASAAALTLVTDDAHAETATATQATSEPTDPHVYVVQANDSYWSIAEDTLRIELGAEPTDRQVLAETHQLMANNSDRLGDPGIPEMLHVDDIVELADPTAVTPAPVVTDASTYVVRDGDSYWRIAEHVLRDELGREPSGAEVLVRTNQLIARNVERLGSPGVPHMLHTGDVVQLSDPPPAPAVMPGPAAEDSAAPTPAAPVVATTPTTTATPAPGFDPQPAAPTTVVEELTPVAPLVSTVTPDAPAADQQLPAASAPSTTVDDSSGSVDAGRLAGMSAVAVAGLAAAWAFRRNRAARSARPHERPAAIPPAEEPTIRELATRDVGGVAWMATELRLLATALPEPALATLTVQLVQFDLTGELEVAFIEISSTRPPAGWTAAAERVWRLTERHAPSALDAVADMPPVVPALVTLGDPASAHLLLNLESVAGVNVHGDTAAVGAWLNSIVWELSGGALAEHPAVILVGVSVAGESDLPDVTSMSAEEAATVIDTESPARPRDTSMLARRAGGGDSWPPTVVLLGDDEIDGQRWAALASRPSVAVVSVGAAIPGGLDVDIAGGQLNIPAWGLRMRAAGLDVPTAEAALGVLATADSPPVLDDLHIAVPTPDTPLERSASTENEDAWETPSWPVMVHLLGEPYATRGGERLALTPQQLSALAYLAVMRTASVDDFNEALWGGAEVKSSRRRELLTDLRKLIGGRNVVGHVEEGRIKAGVDLGTDLTVLEALNARAQEAPDELAARLHQIMNLVSGQPFSYPSASSHLWRWVDHPEHLHALWALRLSTAAWELAGLFLDRGDPGAARDVAERGLIADPLNAALTERLMESYGAMDAVEAVQRVYESHDRALAARGFDGASEETRRVLERLRAARAAEVDSVVGS